MRLACLLTLLIFSRPAWAQEESRSYRLEGTEEQWSVFADGDRVDVLELSLALGDAWIHDKAEASLHYARIPTFCMIGTGLLMQGIGVIGFGIAGLVHAMGFEVDDGALMGTTGLFLGGGAVIGGGVALYHWGTKPHFLRPQRYYDYDELRGRLEGQARVSARDATARIELSLAPTGVGIRLWWWAHPD